MKKAMLLSVLVLLVGATSADARTTIVVEDGMPDFPYQRWATNIALGGAPVLVRESPCPEHLGICVRPDTREIYWGHPEGRVTFQHELGHILDHDWLTDPRRAHFATLVHRQPWTADRYDTPTGELFASMVGSCANPLWTGPNRRSAWIREQWPMRRATFRRACRFIRLAVLDK